MSNAVVAAIEKVEPIKSGTGKRGPWTLFRVTAGGQVYTTFDADWQKAVGQERTFDFETVQREVNGKTYTDRRIVDPKPQARGNPAIVRIEQKVDAQTKLLGEIFSLLNKGAR